MFALPITLPFTFATRVKSLFVVCLLGLTSLNATSAPIDILVKLANKGEHTEVVNAIEQLPTESLTEKHYQLVISAHMAMDIDDAEDAAEDALKAFPNSAPLYLTHASVMGAQAGQSIFSALGYAERALNSLQKAVELKPNHPKYRLALMSFYLAAPGIAGGDETLALEQVNIITELDPQKGAVAMSRYYQATDKTDKAIETIRTAIEQVPNNAMLHHQLGSVYSSLDNYSAAIAAFQQVTQLPVMELPDTAMVANTNKDDLVEARQAQQYRLLNSHYQIGRLALLDENSDDEQYALGVSHLQTYLSLAETLAENDDVSLEGLPNSDRAKLRLSGVFHATGDLDNAKATLATVKVDKQDDNMQSVYKKLQKKLK